MYMPDVSSENVGQSLPLSQMIATTSAEACICLND